MNEPEMVLESKTQSPETMQQVLGADYDELAVTVMTDQPVEETPPAAEPPATPPVEPSSSAPSPAPGPEAGAPPDGGTPATPTEDGQTPEGKRKTSGSAKLKERNQHLQAENTRLAAELETLKKGQPKVEPPPATPPATPQPQATPAPDDPEPQEDQFETWAQYTKALTAWGVREARREEAKKDRLAQEQAESDRKTQQAEESRRQAESAQAAETERWTGMVEEAKEQYPDYDDVMQATKDKIAAAPALVTAVRDHEDGARLAYYLCTHLDEEHRISELVKLPANANERQIRQAVIQASNELNRIAETLAAAPAAPAGASREVRPPESGTPPAAPPAPKPAAAAPAPPKKPIPPTTVGSRGNGNVRKLEQMSAEEVRQMDVDEYRKRRDSGEGA